MPSPTTALSTQRPDLAASIEEYDLEMNRAGFIGNQVFPTIDVAKQAGNFGKIPLKQLLQQRDTARAPGAGYSRGNWTFDKATFATEEHGAEEPVDDREAEMYAEYFDAELLATARAMSAVTGNAEQRIADAVFNTTTWTGASLTTAITNEWDDATNAVPLTDVEAAVRKVWDGSGLMANALILNWRAYRNLRNVAQIIDRVKYQGFMDARAGTITRNALALAFDLEFVIVAGGAKNSANEGQAATPVVIWSDEYAMVAKVAVTNDPREPSIGRTFHWSGDGSDQDGRVESYRDEPIRSDVIRVRHDVDEVMLYAQAGHLLSNVTT